jgi:hypothetical protein
MDGGFSPDRSVYSVGGLIVGQTKIWLDEVLSSKDG